MMLKYGYDKVAITKGASSIEYKTATMPKRDFVTVPKVDAIDTLGAGDIFHGAYCYYKYCKEEDFPTALASASKVASWSTTTYGVVEGVKSFIAKN